MTTVRDIVNDVIVELSQIGSYSTQVYAAPRLQQHVQDAYIMLMDEAWWPDMMTTVLIPMSGVNGKATDPTLDVGGYTNHGLKRYQDIEFAMVAGTEQRLLRLPTNINPYNLSGDNAMFIEPDITTPVSPFRVWPLSATDTLVMRVKVYPSIPMSPDDTVYLDRLMLTYAAAYFYAQDDGTNPGQIDKFQQLLEKRLMQVKRGYEHQPIPLSGPSYAGTNQWQEAPW